MNPRDARHLGLKAQDRVDVISQRGRIRSVELRVTETIATGQVFVPFHYAENNANAATQSAFDPISREPNYKQSAVRVEAASRDEGRTVEGRPLRSGSDSGRAGGFFRRGRPAGRPGSVGGAR